MDLPFLIVVDSLLLFGLLYACCSKINHKYDEEPELHMPLKNNQIIYEEVDIEALYNS